MIQILFFLPLTNRLKPISLSLFLVILFLSFNSNSTESVDAQLKKADKVRSSNPSIFKDILEKLRLEKSLSKKQQHYLEYLTAYELSFTGDFNRSLEIYKKIINTDSSNTIKYRAILSSVNIHAISQNWSEGLNLLNKVFALMETLSDNSLKEQGLILASMLYNLLGQYELGAYYAKIALEKTVDDRNTCLSRHMILKSYFHLNRLENESKEIELGINICNAAKEQIATNLIRTYLAKLSLKNGNHQDAKVLLLRAIPEVEAINYAPLTASFYSLLTQVYLDVNDHNNVKKYANKTVYHAEKSGNSLPLITSYKALYQVYLLEKSHQKALDFYVKYSEANQAHLEGEKAKHLAFQLAQHQTKNKENQIKLLNEKNDLLKVEQALAKTKVANIQLLIGILTVVVAILIYWLGLIRQKHIKAKELAEYDDLTGIYNRRQFTHITNSALRYCERAKQDLSFIMFDLDHFKSVNDTFGHACGDWALIEVTKVCQNIGRQNDVFARIGGEEFCLALPSCSIDEALIRAESLRQAIEDIITEGSGHDFTISASFGVTDVKRSSFSLDKLMADADSAAYTSKRNGRNQVTKFETE